MQIARTHQAVYFKIFELEGFSAKHFKFVVTYYHLKNLLHFLLTDLIEFCVSTKKK